VENIKEELEKFPETDRDDVVILFSAHSLPMKVCFLSQLSFKQPVFLDLSVAIVKLTWWCPRRVKSFWHQVAAEIIALSRRRISTPKS